MEHADPSVAVPELDELDVPIPYRPTPTVHGVPLTRRVLESVELLDAMHVIARRSSPGITLGDLVAEVKAAQAKVVGS